MSHSARSQAHSKSDQDRLLAELKKLVQPFGQEHLLAFWDQLSPPQRAVLADQIRAVDFKLITRLWQQGKSDDDWAELARRAEPPPAVRLGQPHGEFSASAARQRGAEALALGQVGVALVAGGQGTRLGFEHPKGMFPIGPVSQASLFQILFEKVQAVGRRYGVPIPIYLMTSPATHDETVAFLEQNKCFGLSRSDLVVFCQGTMPAVDAQTGRLLLAEPGSLFLNPDGHGGMLQALRLSGALDDMHKRGIENLFYMQVDNPLAGVCDAEFIGFHLLCGSELSTQVVAKRTPLDRVGNVVVIDGVVRIIEYSDLPDEPAGARLADGSLKLWAGSIAIHVFDVDFLTRTADGGGLPFHIVHKVVPFVTSEGQQARPSNPNAFKFEQFIFDLLPSARRAIVYEVDEANGFAPLKNATGAERDSPEQVQSRMVALHTQWLLQCGVTVRPGVSVEISPLFALDVESLRSRIRPGLVISDPTYFDPDRPGPDRFGPDRESQAP